MRSRWDFVTQDSRARVENNRSPGTRTGGYSPVSPSCRWTPRLVHSPSRGLSRTGREATSSRCSSTRRGGEIGARAEWAKPQHRGWDTERTGFDKQLRFDSWWKRSCETRVRDAYQHEGPETRVMSAFSGAGGRVAPVQEKNLCTIVPVDPGGWGGGGGVVAGIWGRRRRRRGVRQNATAAAGTKAKAEEFFFSSSRFFFKKCKENWQRCLNFFLKR